MCTLRAVYFGLLLVIQMEGQIFTPNKSYVIKVVHVCVEFDYLFSPLFVHQMAGRTWSLDQWHQRLSQTYSHQVADITFKNMYSVIVQTLLISDNQLRHNHHK